MSRLLHALVLFSLLIGCERLRPAVDEDAEPGDLAELARALKLRKEHAPLPSVTAALRRATTASGHDAEVESARRLLCQTQLEWFQLAHIAQDVPLDGAGRERLFAVLVHDVKKSASEAPKPSPAGAAASFIVTMLPDVPGLPAVSLDEARRAVGEVVTNLTASKNQGTRALARSARRFLALEAAWRYGRDLKEPVARIKDMLELAADANAAGLADNAWLALRLSFGLAFKRPALPNRELIEGAAAVLGVVPPTTGAKPGAAMLILAPGDGATLPEQLWSSWRALRKAVGLAIDKRSPTHRGTDAEHTWTKLSASLGLDTDPRGPDPTDLHTLGEAQRVEAITPWLARYTVPPLSTPRGLERLEATVHRLAAGIGAADSPRFDGLWVMTVLAIEEAIGLRLPADPARPSLVRLPIVGGTGGYARWSLQLPAGGVIAGFPGRVKTCLVPRTAKGPDDTCLRDLVSEALRAGPAAPPPPRTLPKSVPRPKVAPTIRPLRKPR